MEEPQLLAIEVLPYSDFVILLLGFGMSGGGGGSTCFSTHYNASTVV